MKKIDIWDPLRKKDVPLTPEEDVRQWFIGILNKTMKVPLHMMMSEVGFRLGDKKFRADIIVYGRDASPVAVVECKRKETALGREVLDQAIRYNMVLNVNYIFITNATNTYICKKSTKNGLTQYVFTGEIPTYNQMMSVCSED